MAYCAIENEKTIPDEKTTLILNKTVIGGGPAIASHFTLKYTGSSDSGSGVTGTLFAVTKGEYTLSETKLPGYKLSSLKCNGQDALNKKYNIQGPTVCEFVNQFIPDDPRMEEETKRFIHRRVDNLLTHGPDRARMLRRLQEGQHESLKDGPSDVIPPLKFSGRSGSAGGSTAAAFGPGTPLAGSQLNEPISSFAANVAPLGLGINSRESEFEQSQRKSSGNTFFDAVATQASQMATSSSGFKFGTSISELRAVAKQNEEQAQRKKIEAAGLGYSGVAITTPRMEPKPGFDFWVEGHISRYNDGLGGVNREGHFRILYAGADYIIKPGLLIGALVQIDDTQEKLSQPGETGSIDGTGWMAGPYLGWRILPNLFFDMRGAWGTSNNSIALNDGVARTGEFKTERWLATANLTGNEVIGAWRLSPQIGIAYGHESYDTYKNSLGQTIDGGEANIGRATGKMEVGYRIRAADGMRVEPHLGITGIWNFDTDKLVINGATVSSNENRARLEGGVIVTTTSGWSVRAAANYDGIGASTFESYGGSLWLNFPLN